MSWKSYMQGYREGIYSHPLHLAWKLLWVVPVYVALAVSWLLICIGWGYDRAMQFYDENIW